MADTISQIQTVDFMKDIENILENIGLETIAAKNYDNNEELENLFESYIYENSRPVYLI